MMKPKAKNSKEVLEYIDPSKPVYVYRNLHKNCLSVQQDGIVRCHADNIVLSCSEFKVSDKGREKVRRERKKNVHAKIKGYAVKNPSEIISNNWHKCYYNPYKTDYFMDESNNKYVRSAQYADVDGQECILILSPEYKQ